ncbi:MAG: Wzy polymerase domain-containing protein, partial [Betaproteobacteria bacterium]
MSSQHRLATVGLQLLLIVPWVQPLSAGPSRNTWPWLISATCMATLLLLRHHWRPRALAQATLAAALISCALALLQYFGWAAQLSPWVAVMGPGEGAANLRQRNQFADLTAIGLVALAYLFARAGPQTRRWLPALLALALLAAGHASSASRTGLLAWVMVLLGTLWFCWRSHRAVVGLVALALLLYGLGSAVLPSALDAVLAHRGMPSPCAGGACSAFERMTASASDSRWTLWANVLTLIAQRPWTGWGWNELDYAHYITLFEGARFSDKLDNAHNLPLHLAVELGLPLALLAVLALLLIIWRARPWAETQAWRQAAWGVLAVIGLHSLLEYPLWYGPFQITLIICAASLWLAPRQPRIGTMPSAHRPQGLIDGLALALLLASALVAYDYHRVSQIYLPPSQRSWGYREQPLTQAKASWFFRGHADFASLTLTP